MFSLSHPASSLPLLSLTDTLTLTHSSHTLSHPLSHTSLTHTLWHILSHRPSLTPVSLRETIGFVVAGCPLWSPGRCHLCFAQRDTSILPNSLVHPSYIWLLHCSHTANLAAIATLKAAVICLGCGRLVGLIGQCVAEESDNFGSGCLKMSSLFLFSGSFQMLHSILCLQTNKFWFSIDDDLPRSCSTCAFLVVHLGAGSCWYIAKRNVEWYALSTFLDLKAFLKSHSYCSKTAKNQRRQELWACRANKTLLNHSHSYSCHSHVCQSSKPYALGV